MCPNTKSKHSTCNNNCIAISNRGAGDQNHNLNHYHNSYHTTRPSRTPPHHRPTTLSADRNSASSATATVRHHRQTGTARNCQSRCEPQPPNARKPVTRLRIWMNKPRILRIKLVSAGHLAFSGPCAEQVIVRHMKHPHFFRSKEERQRRPGIPASLISPSDLPPVDRMPSVVTNSFTIPNLGNQMPLANLFSLLPTVIILYKFHLSSREGDPFQKYHRHKPLQMSALQTHRLNNRFIMTNLHFFLANIIQVVPACSNTRFLLHTLFIDGPVLRKNRTAQPLFFLPTCSASHPIACSSEWLCPRVITAIPISLKFSSS